MSNMHVINVKVEGHTALVRELHRTAKYALKPSEMRKIFKKGLVPVSRRAKFNARRLVDADNQNTQWRSELAKAIGYKTPRSRFKVQMNLGYIQEKLPTIGSDGKPYEAFGSKGVKLIHWHEGGVTRKRRGELRPGWPIWRAMQSEWNNVGTIINRELTQRLVDDSRQNEYLKFIRA